MCLKYVSHIYMIVMAVAVFSVLKELIAVEKVKLDDAEERKLKVSISNVTLFMQNLTKLSEHSP